MNDPRPEFRAWAEAAGLNPHEAAAARDLLAAIGAPETPRPDPSPDPPPWPPWPDFLARYPPEMRERALDILRERDPAVYAEVAPRYRALAIR